MVLAVRARVVIDINIGGMGGVGREGAFNDFCCDRLAWPLRLKALQSRINLCL